MTVLSDIETALICAGLEKLNHKPKASGKGTTACWIYSFEDDKLKVKVTVQATPKYTLLELLDKMDTGGN